MSLRTPLAAGEATPTVSWNHAPAGKPTGLSPTTYRSPTSQRPTSHRLEATQALWQVLHSAICWGMIDCNPAKVGVLNPTPRRKEQRPLGSWTELTPGDDRDLPVQRHGAAPLTA